MFLDGGCVALRKEIVRDFFLEVTEACHNLPFFELLLRWLEPLLRWPFSSLTGWIGVELIGGICGQLLQGLHRQDGERVRVYIRSRHLRNSQLVWSVWSLVKLQGAVGSRPLERPTSLSIHFLQVLGISYRGVSVGAPVNVDW